MLPTAETAPHTEKAIAKDDGLRTPDSNSPGPDAECMGLVGAAADGAPGTNGEAAPSKAGSFDAKAPQEETLAASEFADNNTALALAVVPMSMRTYDRRTFGSLYASTVQPSRPGAGRRRHAGDSPTRGARELAKRLRSNSGFETPTASVGSATPPTTTAGAGTDVEPEALATATCSPTSSAAEPPPAAGAAAVEEGGVALEAPEVARARMRAARAREATAKVAELARARAAAAAEEAGRRRRLARKQKAPPAFAALPAPPAAASSAEDAMSPVDARKGGPVGQEVPSPPKVRKTEVGRQPLSKRERD